jgi:hypothetical protein
MVKECRRFVWFRRRIPLDILRHPRFKADGLELRLPVGDEIIRKRLAPWAVEVTLSLRTEHRSEGVTRKSEVSVYLDKTWTTLRKEHPISLTSRQAIALVGDLYRYWAHSGGWATAITYAGDEAGRMHPELLGASPNVEQSIFAASLARVTEISDDRLEALLGPVADKYICAKGVTVVRERRPELLRSLHAAFRDASNAREKRVASTSIIRPEAKPLFEVILNIRP